MDFTGPQVYKGLAGLYLLRDEVEDSLPLPQGEKEVPLVITDRTFNEDGSLYYPSLDPSLKEEPGTLAGAINGFFSDTILVNGAPWPYLEVSNTRYRFRVLNASNARFYDLVLDPPPPGGKPFMQVGSDGGLLEAPVSHDRILTSPGERFDVVVDFSQYRVGQEVTLKNLEGTVKELRSQIEIEAPAERVWQVLTNFAAYPEWNPFIRRVNGRPEVEEQLVVRMRPSGTIGG